MVSIFRNILTYQFLKCTQHAILDIVNDTQDNMDKKMFSCGIFIDLKKTFDTIDHTKQMQKLTH